jgi:hypothetical protein
MKKKIIIISVVLIGFFLAVTANSWAQRERGSDRRENRGGDFENGDRSAVHKFNQDRSGHFQKWNKPAVRKFNRDRGRAYQPKRHHYRPAHRSKHQYNRRHHYRVPPRFRPEFRPWRHRPVYRGGHPRHFKWRHLHSVVQETNNYYSSAESYAAPQDEFQASAAVSDSGFSVSVGVSKTN